MFTKAGLLIAVCLVIFGYRLGKPKAPAPQPQAPAQAAAPKKEWISVKALLVVVAVLLVIAILSSLSGKIG